MTLSSSQQLQMTKEVNAAVCQPTAVAGEVDVNEDLRAVIALEPLAC